MENPASWTSAERVVDQVIREHRNERARATLSRGKARIGLSLARRITDALREEGLLREVTKEQKVAQASEALNFWLEPDNWAYLNATRPDLVKRLKAVIMDAAKRHG